MNKFFWMSPSFAQYLKLIFAAISFFAVFSTLAFSQSTNSTASTSVTSALCKIYNTIRNVIFLLGLTLAILGGAIYAASALMPGSHKAGFQGYGMGMIIGGVLGVAIAVAAPYILNLIVQANQNSILTGTGVAGANGLCASASII
jgi:hypothetical protein